MADKKTPITVAHGDGIGPEIMASTLKVLDAAGAALDIETIEIGEAVYKKGIVTGIEPAAWESLLRTRVFLKAPITTPQGAGYKSLNVAARKRLGLYANVRPCKSYHPFIHTKHPEMDVVIIRENEEDCYTGIEHRQTTDVIQCLKLISRPGCERIVRYAFEYAKANGRKKITCFVKDNIMKMTDGLFHRVFDEIAGEYPEIENDHWIVDIGAAKVADHPEVFDVIVMPNLYGDIISDIAAQITGSVGLVGSSNIGVSCAMFEAIHGSAPPLAGNDTANPSALILGSVLMLSHIGQAQVAARVHNAWLRTIEEGMHTADIYKQGTSMGQALGTQAFTDEVIKRMGKSPETLRPVSYESATSHADITHSAPVYVRENTKKELVGIDIFIEWPDATPSALAEKLKTCEKSGMQLVMLSNRGISVWPEAIEETFCVDHFRCRYISEAPVSAEFTLEIQSAVIAQGLDLIKTENLYNFDGKPGFSNEQ